MLHAFHPSRLLVEPSKILVKTTAARPRFVALLINSPQLDLRFLLFLQVAVWELNSATSSTDYALFTSYRGSYETFKGMDSAHRGQTVIALMVTTPYADYAALNKCTLNYLSRNVSDEAETAEGARLFRRSFDRLRYEIENPDKSGSFIEKVAESRAFFELLRSDALFKGKPLPTPSVATPTPAPSKGLIATIMGRGKEIVEEGVEKFEEAVGIATPKKTEVGTNARPGLPSAAALQAVRLKSANLDTGKPQTPIKQITDGSRGISSASLKNAIAGLNPIKKQDPNPPPAKPKEGMALTLEQAINARRPFINGDSDEESDSGFNDP